MESGKERTGQVMIRFGPRWGRSFKFLWGFCYNLAKRWWFNPSVVLHRVDW